MEVDDGLPRRNHVALQGTIDAFPVANVLQLLAGSKKTGRLIVEGDRSTAQLFVADGQVTGGSIRDSVDDDMADVVLELLRYRAGSFLFEPGSVDPDAVSPQDLDGLVEAATERLAVWVAVEEVVPSMRHRISLVPDVGPDGIQLSASEWKVVIAASTNAQVSELVGEEGVSDLAACRLVAELVGRGVVVVDGPGSGLVLADSPLEVAADAGAETREEEPLSAVVETEPATILESTQPQPAEAQIVEAEIVAVEDGLIGDGEQAYEVVLLDPDEVIEEGTGFPEHFPIDDLLAAEEDEDPWVTLENAAREDRLAAAQDFGGHSSEGGGSFDGGGATFTDGYSSGAFSSDSPDAPSTAGTGAAAHVDRVAADTLLDPSALAGDRAPTDGAVFAGDLAFSGDGAFTDAPVAVRDAVTTAADTAADEVLRQMSKLSPKAAEAIAAALGPDAGQIDASDID